MLRITRCADCGAYTHPPLPRCRVCRGDRVALAPVSGRGVVAGFTVNHQQWLADFPPPYVIAVVALEEDDGARLTTNIVNCPPEDVRIGMPVRVLFEKAGDVYLPLFEPQEPQEPQHPDIERSRLTLAIPADREVGGPRPRASAAKFEERVALTGVGQSRVGRRLMTDPLRLTVDACLAAVADAGLDLDEIDGLSTYPGRVGSPGFTEGGIAPLTEALQLRPTWINGAGDTPGQGGAVVAGMLAVAAGLCRHVLCYRTVWESSFADLTRTGGRGRSAAVSTAETTTATAPSTGTSQS